MSLIFSAKRFFTLVAAMLILTPTYAKESIPQEEFEVGEMIMHHISDAHEWHLWGGHHDGKSIYMELMWRKRVYMPENTKCPENR